MFFNQIRLRNGLPFPVEIPNETTLKTFRTTDKGEDLNAYDNLDEMFEATPFFQGSEELQNT